MRVILKETIDSLGIIGTEVEIAEGFGRNFLLPQKKAVLATPQNRRVLEQEKVKFELQIAKEKEIAQQTADKLADVSCTVTAKVSDGDQLYGSVTVRDIIKALDKEGVKIEKRMILLKDPIKTIGTFKVPVRVYKEVEPEITVNVVAE